MVLKIKNAEVERLAAEVARITGETKTEAIRRALEDHKNRLLQKNRRKLTSKSSKTQNPIGEIMDYLEHEVWPKIPGNVLGKKITKREREKILGMQI